MGNNTVGVVSFDLVINSKLEQQLSTVAKKAEAEVNNRFSAVNKAVENALNIGDSASKSVEQAMQKAVDAIDESIIDIRKKTKKNLEEAIGETNVTKNVEVSIKTVGGYDNSVIAWMDEYEKKQDEVANKAKISAGETKSIGESYQAALNPVELLSQKLENLHLQMEAAQKQHERLTAQMSKLDDEDMGGVAAQKLGNAITASESKILSLQESINRTKAKIEDALNPEEAVKKSSGTFKNFGSNIKDVFQGVGSGVKKSVEKIGDKVKSVASKSLNKVQSSVKKVTRGIGSAFRSVFLMAGVYAAFKGLRALLSNAANQNEEFKKSLNTVKANLMAAFAPIMTAVMPILNNLMSVMSVASRKIAEFVSGIFGTTYEKSMAAAKGIETAAKKAKKATTGFDELNILGSGDNDKGIDYDNIDTTTDEQAVGKMAQLKTQTSQFFDKIGELASAAITKLSGYAPAIMLVAVTLIKSFVSGLQQNLPEIASTGLSAIKTLCDGISQILPQIGYLAADIVGVLLDGLITTAETLIPAGIKAVGNFLEGMSKSIPQLIPKAKTAIMTIVKSIRDNLPSILNSGMSILMSLLDGIVSMLPELIPVALDCIMMVVNSLIENLPAVADSGIKILLAIIDGIIQIIPELIPAITTVCATIEEAIINNLPEIIDMGIALLLALVDGMLGSLDVILNMAPRMISTLIDGIVNAIPKLIDAAVEIVVKLVSFIVDNLGDLIMMGPKIMFSIASGIIKAIPELLKAVPKMIKALIDKILDTDWIQVGKDILKQILGGIGNIADSVKNGVSGAWDSIKSGASSAGSWLKDKLSFFAEGGIVRQPTLAMIGESGAEAVVPLEQNTGGLNKLAELLSNRLPANNNSGSDGGNWTIQVVDTDGNIKAESIISAAERRNRRDGRTILPIGT